MRRFAKHAIFYGVLIGTWALLAYLKIWPPYLFPTPKGVIEALYGGFADHSFWIAIAVSMRRLVIGYAISVILGMVLGLGVASNKFLEETMGGLLVSLQSLPSICWSDRSPRYARRETRSVRHGHSDARCAGSKAPTCRRRGRRVEQAPPPAAIRCWAVSTRD